MKTIVSDISLNQFQLSENMAIFDSDNLRQTTHCAGCFSCWLKTPGSCIFKDTVSDFTNAMKQCDTLYLLTQNLYGSYSPLVKCAIDRSLSYVQPYFTIRNHEMHHVLTTDHRLQLIVIAYGSDNVQEQTDLDALVQANGINMDCKEVQCHHCVGKPEALALLQTLEGGISI